MTLSLSEKSLMVLRSQIIYDIWCQNRLWVDWFWMGRFSCMCVCTSIEFSCVDVCICVVYSSFVGVYDPVYVHISIFSLSSVLVGWNRKLFDWIFLPFQFPLYSICKRCDFALERLKIKIKSVANLKIFFFQIKSKAQWLLKLKFHIKLLILFTIQKTTTNESLKGMGISVTICSTIIIVKADFVWRTELYWSYYSLIFRSQISLLTKFIFKNRTLKHDMPSLQRSLRPLLHQNVQ